MRFRLIAGKHHERSRKEAKGTGTQPGHVYKKGDVVTSDLDLAKMFPNKFERLPDDAPKEARAAAAKQEADAKIDNSADLSLVASPPPLPDTRQVMDPPDRDTSAALVSELGENVTPEFPKATEAGLVVFKDGAEFSVTTKEDTTKNLAGRPLKKSDVESFAAARLSGASKVAVAQQKEAKAAEDEDEEDEEQPRRRSAKKKVKKTKRK